MPPGEIDCHHCGNTIRTKRPDRRKWCDRCRVLRDLLHLRARAHKCVVCDRRYFAWNSASARAATRVCADCAGWPTGETRDGEACAYCDRADRLLPGLALCWLCATDAADRKKSERVIKSVANKLKEVAA